MDVDGIGVSGKVARYDFMIYFVYLYKDFPSLGTTGRMWEMQTL